MIYPKVEGYPDQAEIEWEMHRRASDDVAIFCPVEGCGVQIGWQHVQPGESRETWVRRHARNPGMTCEQCYRAEAMHRAVLAHRAEIAAAGGSDFSVVAPDVHRERAEAFLRWFNRPDVAADRYACNQKAYHTLFFCVIYTVTAKTRPAFEVAFCLGMARWSWSQMDRATRRRTLESWREVKLEVRERIAALREEVVPCSA